MKIRWEGPEYCTELRALFCYERWVEAEASIQHQVPRNSCFPREKEEVCWSLTAHHSQTLMTQARISVWLPWGLPRPYQHYPLDTSGECVLALIQGFFTSTQSALWPDHPLKWTLSAAFQTVQHIVAGSHLLAVSALSQHMLWLKRL